MPRLRPGLFHISVESMTKVVDGTEEPAHAALSPSSSDRWIQCPGSVQAQEGIQDRGDNEFSLLGTAAHALLEMSLRLGVEPSKLMDATIEPGHPKVDEDMVDAVNVAYDFVEEYLDHHGHDNVTLHIERRVAIGPAINVPPEACNGTADIQLVHHDGSALTTVDYKHGSGVKVFAERNPQLLLYSAGGRHEEGRPFKKYRQIIIQPRAGKRSSVDEWEIRDGALSKWLREEVAPSARAALLPNPPRNAGTHCRWCKAAPVCRTYRNKVVAVAGTEFDSVEPLDPETIPLSEYPRILAEAKVLENWIRAVRGHALRVLEQGGTIPGFKLGWGRRVREWDNLDGLTDWLKKHNVKQDDYMPRTLLSPNEMTKLIRHHKLMPKKARGSDEKPVNPIDAFVKYSIPKPAIQPVEGGGEFDEVGDDE